jgi:uncharacterized membrane protein
MWLIYAIAAAFFFGATNIIDSLIINKYEKSSVVYLFFPGWMMTIILGVLALFVDVRTEWMLFIVTATIIGYIGDLLYFHVLGRMDVSVVNACWAIFAIFVSIGGFLLFEETWTLFQTLGSVFVIIGVFLLSYWHKHVSISYTIFLFSLVALFFVPGAFAQKAALIAGENEMIIVYWLIMGRNIPNILVPLCKADWRAGVLALPQRVHPDFYLVMLAVIVVWFAGLYASILSFKHGLLSLATIASNIQPFFVIFQAWLLSLCLPRYAPRELLTAQSVQVKLMSFVVVFVGLVMLAIG